MPSSNGNSFRVTGPLWGEPPITSGFPTQRPVTWSFDIFFDLRLNKQLSKQSRRRSLESHRSHYDVAVMSISPGYAFFAHIHPCGNQVTPVR